MTERTKLSGIWSSSENADHRAPESEIPTKTEPKWPVGGYAPGRYLCICQKCTERFQGDKRAYMCPDCVIQSLIAVRFTVSPARERSQQVRDALQEMSNKAIEAMRLLHD